MLYIENEGLRVWDMFSRLDKNGDMKLSYDEVKAGLKVSIIQFIILIIQISLYDYLNNLVV